MSHGIVRAAIEFHDTVETGLARSHTGHPAASLVASFGRNDRHRLPLSVNEPDGFVKTDMTTLLKASLCRECAADGLR